MLYPDHHESDGTAAAHPAWWRGHEAGTDDAVVRIRKVLDGTDHGEGYLGSRALERLRRELLDMKRRIDQCGIALRSET